MSLNSTPRTEYRLRELVDMYNAAERPGDLDDVQVSIDMTGSVDLWMGASQPACPRPIAQVIATALGDVDHRSAEFDRFLSSCRKPSDLVHTPSPFPCLPWGEEERDADDLFVELDEEAFHYGYVNPWGVACDLAKRWIREGYASVWLRSDGKVYKSRGMIGNGDDWRVEGGPSPYRMDARRIALTNKKESGRAIVGAIRMGQRFPEICEPAQLPVRVPGLDANAPDSWARTQDDYEGEFSDGDAPPEACDGGAPSELESLLSASVEAESAKRRIEARRVQREAVANVEIERIPVHLDLSCPFCFDETSFCDCKDLGLVGKLAA